MHACNTPQSPRGGTRGTATPGAATDEDLADDLDIEPIETVDLDVSPEQLRDFEREAEAERERRRIIMERRAQAHARAVAEAEARLDRLCTEERATRAARHAAMRATEGRPTLIRPL